MIHNTQFEYSVQCAVIRLYMQCYPGVDDPSVFICDCLDFRRVAHAMTYYSPLLQRQLATATNQRELARQDLAVRLALWGDDRSAIPLPAAIAHQYNQTREAVKVRLAALGRQRGHHESFFYFKDESGNVHATFR
jgi:hypothetical protein